MNQTTFAPARAKVKSTLSLRGRGLLQRQCACVDSARTHDDEDARKKLSVQRFATNDAEVEAVPPIVYEVLRSPGQPLDAVTRAFMEQRFGHDFSQVRVHTDGKAAESAEAVNALAYTVGHDVVFGAEAYAPQSFEGQRLLAHELTHTIQQSQNASLRINVSARPASTEQEAEAAVHALASGYAFHTTRRALPHLARQQPAATATETLAPMTRKKFDAIMKTRYRVKTIRKGTFQDQRKEIFRDNAQDQAFGDLKEDDWHAWDPDAEPSIYNQIVEAFENVEKVIGGLPLVNDIVFFELAYEEISPGHAEKNPGILSSYGNGQLTIYKRVTTGYAMLQISGSIVEPTPEQAVHRNITHELGHGIFETVVFQAEQPPGADEKMKTEYPRAVGWTETTPPELYDIQASGVRGALKNGTPPPADAHITPGNWSLEKWKERPVTQYMVVDPGDDFAEAVMAYVNELETLKKLSPARYKFLDERKALWLPSAQKQLNLWEAVKKGGQPRTLKPSAKPNIWERAKEQ